MKVNISDGDRQPLCNVTTREHFVRNRGKFEKICHFIVDEAQNFQNETYWMDWFGQIREILSASAAEKAVSLYVFCDKLQKHKVDNCGFFYLDGSLQSPWPLPFVKRRFRTVIRNSEQIYSKWKAIADKVQESKSNGEQDRESEHGQNDDWDVEVGHDYGGCEVNKQELSWHSNEELAKELSKVVNDILVERAFNPKDIAILFQTNEIAAKMRDLLKKLCLKVTDAEDFLYNRMVVDSVRRFSGLEAPVVIAVDYYATGFEDSRKLDIMLYSRAMVQLHLISNREILRSEV